MRISRFFRFTLCSSGQNVGLEPICACFETTSPLSDLPRREPTIWWRNAQPAIGISGYML